MWRECTGTGHSDEAQRVPVYQSARQLLHASPAASLAPGPPLPPCGGCAERSSFARVACQIHPVHPALGPLLAGRARPQ